MVGTSDYEDGRTMQGGSRNVCNGAEIHVLFSKHCYIMHLEGKEEKTSNGP